MTAQNLVNTPDNRLVVDAVSRRRKAFRGTVF